jgi:hypothetical protein
MPLLLLVGCRAGLLLSSVVTAKFCRLSKFLLETTFEAIPHHQGAWLSCKYQFLLKSIPPFVSATAAASLCPGFLPVTLQVLLVWETLPCTHESNSSFPKLLWDHGGHLCHCAPHRCRVPEAQGFSKLPFWGAFCWRSLDSPLTLSKRDLPKLVVGQ